MNEFRILRQCLSEQWWLPTRPTQSWLGVFEVGDLDDIVEGDSNVGDNLKIIGIKAKIIDLHLGESGIVLGILQVLVESQCEL